MLKTREELKNDVPEYIKSLGIISPDKTTGESLRIMLNNIIDSMAAVNEIFPRGAIVAWHGNEGNIPDGWYFCDGTTYQTPLGPLNTPDLRGRTIYGIDPSARDGVKDGGRFAYHKNNGGAHMRSLTVANLPPHKHIYSDDSNADNRQMVLDAGIRRYGTASDGGSSSSGSRGAGLLYETSSTGSGNAFDNMPPYYVATWIMYGGRKLRDYESGFPSKAQVHATIYSANRFEMIISVADKTNIVQLDIFCDDVWIGTIDGTTANWIEENGKFVLYYGLSDRNFNSGQTYRFSVKTINRDGLFAESNIYGTVWYAPLKTPVLHLTENINYTTINLALGMTHYDYTKATAGVITIIEESYSNISNVFVRYSTNANMSSFRTLTVWTSSGSNKYETQKGLYIPNLEKNTRYYMEAVVTTLQGETKYSNKIEFINTSSTTPPGGSGGSGGSGGGGGCPIQGSLITLADGSTMPIEDLMVGDKLKSIKVKGFKDSHRFGNIKDWNIKDSDLDINEVITEVEEISVYEQPNYYSINNQLNVSNTHIHLHMRDGVWKFSKITDVKVGDYMIDKNQNVIRVDSVEVVDKKVFVYGLKLTEGKNTLFVDGILTHNNIQAKEVI